jgi:hypothetical protein
LDSPERCGARRRQWVRKLKMIRIPSLEFTLPPMNRTTVYPK